MHNQADLLPDQPALRGIDAPPALPSHALARPALLTQLAAHDTGICLIQGPPGSGKTWLMRQYAAHLQLQDRNVLWLDIGAGDNQPAPLLQRLQALQQGCLLDPAAVVFIDALQRLHEPVCSELLDDAVLDLANRHAVLIASQRGHGALLHQARLNDRMHELPANCLRFSDQEAAQLLGPAFHPDQAQRLNALVSGWAAGLRLFAQDPVASCRLLACPEGSAPLPGAMADYFDAVVCAALPPADLQLLMELSVLEHFTPDLLSALPGLEQAWPLVRAHIQAGRFIHYTDEAREWAGFHPAFGRHLRQLMRQQQRARHDQLQWQAAGWLAAHGHRGEVLRHAVALGRHPAAAQLLEQAGAINIDVGDSPDLALPFELAAEHAGRLPLLFLSQVYRQIRHGRARQAAARFQHACELTAGFTRLEAQTDAAQLQVWVYLMQVLMHSIHDHPVEAGHVHQLQSLLEQQLEEPSVLTIGVASVLAYALNQLGRPADSASVCRTALQLQSQARGDKAAVFVCLHHAWAQLADGTLERSQEQVAMARTLAGRQCHSLSYEMLSVDILTAQLLHETGQHHQALALLDNVLPHIATINGWHHLLASAFSVAAHCAGHLHGLEAGRRVLQAGHAQAHDRQWPRLSLAMDITGLELLIDAGQLQAGVDLLASPGLSALLDDPAPDLHHQWLQIPALLASARLQVELGRPRLALDALERVRPLPLMASQQTFRLQALLLEMRAQQALRRVSAANALLRGALELGLQAGLVYRLQRQARHLRDVRANASHDTSIPLAHRHFLDSLPENTGAREGDRLPGARIAGNCMLSPREAQTITLMAEGCTTKEIARRLGISEGTVKTHRKKIHEKLGVTSRSQALTRARELLIL